MPELMISIGGREFEVSCQPGEEHFLRTAAGMLDGEASALMGQIGRLPEGRMLLMAGLMVADKAAGMEDQLRNLQGRLDEIEAQMSEAQRVIDTARADAQARADAAEAEAAARIAAAEADFDTRLAAALAEAETLRGDDGAEAARAEAEEILTAARAEAARLTTEAAQGAEPVEVLVEVPVIPDELLRALDGLAARAEGLADRVEDVD